MEIDIEPVSVDVRENKTFKSIVSLVDNPSFRMDLAKARKLIGLSDLIPLERAREWLADQRRFQNKDEWFESVQQVIETFYGKEVEKVKINKVSDLIHLTDGHETLADEVSVALE